MNKRRRKWIVLVAATALGSVLFFALPSRGPNYGGRSLESWLLQLEWRQGVDDAGPSIYGQRRADVCRALQAMGPEVLPHLVGFLASPPKVSWRQRATLWINSRQKLYELPYWGRHLNRSALAIEAFDLLGPEAAAAVPALITLYTNEATSELAAFCLERIGAPAVPAFVQGLTNENEAVRGAAFRALTHLGPKAEPAVPVLEQMVAETNGLAGFALQAMSAIDPNPQRWLPVLATNLDNTNIALQAAFCLGRLGSNGVPVLIRQLKGEDTRRSAGILAALKMNATRVRDQPDFQSQLTQFHDDARLFEDALRQDRKRHFLASSVTVALKAGLDLADEPTRLLVVTNLAELGTPALPALALAANDPSFMVRQTAQSYIARFPFETRLGAIIRGPTDKKRIALLFTGHEYGEAAEVILEALKRNQARASFFLTGDFLANTNFTLLVRAIAREGHYLGPHSDKHLLYCSWDAERKTLVTRSQFRNDLMANMQKVVDVYEPFSVVSFPLYYPQAQTTAQIFGLRTSAPHEGITNAVLKPAERRILLPPYEHYNQEIAFWTLECGMTLINFTPGTRSNADYTGEADKNFVDSQTIFDSIVKREREDPHGLNGFLLLLHIGAGPGRGDKFHTRFAELLEFLKARGYELVRVDELLAEP